jgi:hypothetical protein
LSGKPYPKAVETVNRGQNKCLFIISVITRVNRQFFMRIVCFAWDYPYSMARLFLLSLALQAIQREQLKNLYFFANPEVFEWFAAQDSFLI